MKHRMICIIGPDGVGKTTQVHMLIETLKEKGYNPVYKWFRFYHFFSLPLLGLARILGLSSVDILKNGKKIGYHSFGKSKIISKLYTYFLLIDTITFFYLKIYSTLKFSQKNIICDRFLYDTLVDLMISTNNHKIYRTSLGKKFLNLMPINVKVILLNSTTIILKKRRDDVFYDKNMELKVQLYNTICHYYNIPYINANQEIEKIHNIILKEIGIC